MIGDDDRGNDFTSAGGNWYPRHISRYGDVDTMGKKKYWNSEDKKIATLLFCGSMIFVFIAVFGGLTYGVSKGYITTAAPKCQQETVLAAYIVQNGGSPYYAISIADYYGNVTSKNYWDSVPYIGEKLTLCN